MEIGERMKNNYELRQRRKLIRRMPVILRLDGKAFHTLTKGAEKPFDEGLRMAMQKTAIKLCSEIQNVKLAYCQSDEISLFLVDYSNLDTDQWFDGNVDKMNSIAAAIASVEFSKIWGSDAYFDSRAFNIPKEEVCNYFIWRQLDATRNSIQMVAQSKFSHKSLQGLNTSDLQEKLFTEKEINWNDTETKNKRGYCIVKEGEGWVVDFETPIFTKDREYVEKYLISK